jgi:predicted RecA/RadA family phage recombinase
MKNIILSPGDTIPLTNTTGSTVSSGGLFVINALTGVAVNDVADSATGEFLVKNGVVDVSVKGHNGSSNTAVSVGNKVYYTSGEAFCDVDSNAQFFGFALETVTAGGTSTIRVLKSI